MFQKQTWLVFPLYFIHIGLKGNIFMYSMEKCPSMEIYEVDTFYGVNVMMVPTNNTDKDFVSYIYILKCATRYIFGCRKSS